MIYGYARCSTDESRQDINRQKRDLLAMGVSEEKDIYWEYESGTKKNRPELEKLLAIVKSGDTIATTEVSRLTRSTRQLCDIMQTIQERKLRLLIGNFTVDCRREC
jgi:DNA invertase Pin-like site-specific DNA recombinase